MPKIIGFFGSDPADICLYAAYALRYTGRKVCVIDNSEDGVLFRCIPVSGGQPSAVTFHNVDFRRLEPIIQWHELDYEYVFVQLGAQPPELCLALCSERVLVVDCERKNLDFYNQFMQQSSMPVAVLLRGICMDWCSLKKVKEHFECGNAFVDQWLLLPFHKADEAYRLEMQFGMMNKSAHISRDMERVLMQLLQIMGEGMIEHCILE